MNADAMDWPSGFRELQEIESMLKCPICYEDMDTAVLAPKCSHTFCSLCIRRYLSYKTQCPTCSSPLVEPDLVTNRFVDNLIQQFKNVRSKLFRALKNSGPVTSTEDEKEPSESSISPSASRTKEPEGDPSLSAKPIAGKLNFPKLINKTTKTSTDPFKSNHSKRPKRHKSKAKYVDTDSEESDIVISDNDDSPYVPPESDDFKTLRISPPKDVMSPRMVRTPQRSTSSSAFPVHQSPATPVSTSGSGSMLTSSVSSPGPSQSSTSSNASQTQTIPPSKPEIVRVPCPVCGVDVPQRNINLHLDSCLKGGDKAPARPPPPRRKTLPKLVYALMKDPQLRKCLNEAGLSTHGDRQAMIKRHHEYTLAYNAQCDSLNPKSAAEIAQEIKKNEENRNKSSTTNTIKTKFFVPKGASSQDVEDAQKTYVKKHKDQFKQLIEEAKKRRAQKKLEQASKAEDSVAETKPPESTPSSVLPGTDDIPSSQNVTRWNSSSIVGNGVVDVDLTETAPVSSPSIPPLVNSDSKDSGIDSGIDKDDKLTRQDSISTSVSSSQSSKLTFPGLPSLQVITDNSSEGASEMITTGNQLNGITNDKTASSAGQKQTAGFALSDDEIDDSDRALLVAEARVTECNGYVKTMVSPKLNTDDEDTVPFSSGKTDKKLASLYEADTEPVATHDDETQPMDVGDDTQSMSGSEDETQALPEDEDATQAVSGSGSEDEVTSSPLCRPAQATGSPADELFPSMSSKHDDSDSDVSDILLDLSQCAPTAVPVPQDPESPSSPAKQPAASVDNHLTDSTSPVFQSRAIKKRRRSADNSSEEFAPKKQKSVETKSKSKQSEQKAKKPAERKDAEINNFSPRKTRRQLRSRTGN